jgi:hypothetical protein
LMVVVISCKLLRLCADADVLGSSIANRSDTKHWSDGRCRDATKLLKSGRLRRLRKDLPKLRPIRIGYLAWMQFMLGCVIAQSCGKAVRSGRGARQLTGDRSRGLIARSNSSIHR